MSAVAEDNQAQPVEEEAPPKLRTVHDFGEPTDLLDALDTSVDDWELKNYEMASSGTDPNDAEIEARRLLVLKSYNVLDSENEEEFDLITQEAQRYFKVSATVDPS